MKKAFLMVLLTQNMLQHVEFIRKDDSYWKEGTPNLQYLNKMHITVI